MSTAVDSLGRLLEASPPTHRNLFPPASPGAPLDAVLRVPGVVHRLAEDLEAKHRLALARIEELEQQATTLASVASSAVGSISTIANRCEELQKQVEALAEQLKQLNERVANHVAGNSEFATQHAGARDSAEAVVRNMFERAAAATSAGLTHGSVKLNAIRAVRVANRIGLLEAKDFVDCVIEQMAKEGFDFSRIGIGAAGVSPVPCAPPRFYPARSNQP